MNRTSTGTIISLAVVALITAAVVSKIKSSGANGSFDPPDTLGVANFKGDWIIKPRYQEIIYVKSIDSYWVKIPRSSVANKPWTLGLLTEQKTNPRWKLLDRNGVEQKSELPENLAPLAGVYATTLEMMAYNQFILVEGANGIGICDAKGRPVTAMDYDCLYDVGDGVWAGQRVQRDRGLHGILVNVGLARSLRREFGSVELIDHSGNVIAALPSRVTGFRSKYKNGLLYCNIEGRDLQEAVDRQGRFTGQTANLPPLADPDLTIASVPHHSESIGAKIASAPSTPPQLLTVGLPKESDRLHGPFRPYVLGDNLLCLPIKIDNKYYWGLTDSRESNGTKISNWKVPPIYARLMYCGPDRIAASKDRPVHEQPDSSNFILGQY